MSKWFYPYFADMTPESEMTVRIEYGWKLFCYMQENGLSFVVENNSDLWSGHANAKTIHCTPEVATMVKLGYSE